MGLAYTTTVGVETAMNGIPVIFCGHTHYRGRGFTIDPNTWDDYFATLEKVLADLPAHRLNEEQMAQAWNYAYRFFFEYPRPFPWRLMNFWDDLEVWPVRNVLSEEASPSLVIRSRTWSESDLRGKKLIRLTRRPLRRGAALSEYGKHQTTGTRVLRSDRLVACRRGFYQNARYEDLRPVSRNISRTITCV